KKTRDLFLPNSLGPHLQSKDYFQLNQTKNATGFSSRRPKFLFLFRGPDFRRMGCPLEFRSYFRRKDYPHLFLKAFPTARKYFVPYRRGRRRFRRRLKKYKENHQVQKLNFLHCDWETVGSNQ